MTGHPARRADPPVPAGLRGGPIYLDYNATTPVDPRVIEAMLPYLTTHPGNPSSSHHHAEQPRRALAIAREQVARLIGAAPEHRQQCCQHPDVTVRRPMAAITRTPRHRWVEEGPRALAAGGPGAVRVEVLAQARGGSDVVEGRDEGGQLPECRERAVGAVGVGALVELDADERGRDRPGQPGGVGYPGDRAVAQEPLQGGFDLGDPQRQRVPGGRGEAGVGAGTGEDLGQHGHVASPALPGVQLLAKGEQVPERGDLREPRPGMPDLLGGGVAAGLVDELGDGPEVGRRRGLG